MINFTYELPNDRRLLLEETRKYQVIIILELVKCRGYCLVLLPEIRLAIAGRNCAEIDMEIFWSSLIFLGFVTVPP